MATIQIKRSATATNVPGSLAAGELAINTADEKLFYANSASTVKEVDLQSIATGLQNLVEDLTPQLGGDLDLNGNNIDFPTTANIGDVISATDLTGAANTNLATALAIKTYVDNEVASAITSSMVYQGTADASAVDVDTATGTATHNNGDLYKVTVAGSTAFGFQLNVGDFVVYNGATWDRIDAVDATVSGTASRIAVTGDESTGFTVDIDAAYVGQSSITTLGTITTGTWTGDTIAIANGGTGATTAAGARTNLGVDAAGTDNSTNVTLVGAYDYITISGQEITRNQIDLGTDVTGSLDGGTF